MDFVQKHISDAETPYIASSVRSFFIAKMLAAARISDKIQGTEPLERRGKMILTF